VVPEGQKRYQQGQDQQAGDRRGARLNLARAGRLNRKWSCGLPLATPRSWASALTQRTGHASGHPDQNCDPMRDHD
jgi:hypothetical protein